MRLMLVVEKLSGVKMNYAIELPCLPRLGETIAGTTFGFATVKDVVYLTAKPNDGLTIVHAVEEAQAGVFPMWFKDVVAAANAANKAAPEEN